MYKFIIGLAQVNKSYGVVKSEKKKEKNHFRNLLNYAISKKIKILDYSFNYGAPQKFEKFLLNEVNIKKCLKINPNHLKLNKFKSIKNLKYLLIHNPKYLYEKNNKIFFEYFRKLKTQSDIKIGVSIYTIKDFYAALKIFGNSLDVVQLPMNIIDRKFESKKIINLFKKKKIEIHVRSIFLQGLLLCEKNERPNYFRKWDNFFKNWDTNLNKKDKMIECLNYFKKFRHIKYIVIGVNEKKQLDEILKNSEQTSKKFDFIKNFKSNNQKLIDPRLWKIK